MAIQSINESGIVTWAKYNSALVGERSSLAEPFGMKIFMSLDPNSDLSSQAITHDSDGNLYYKTYVPQESNKTLLIKFNSDMDIVWAKSYDFGSTSVSYATWDDLPFDASGNPIIFIRINGYSQDFFTGYVVDKTTGNVLSGSINGTYFASYPGGPEDNDVVNSSSRSGSHLLYLGRSSSHGTWVAKIGPNGFANMTEISAIGSVNSQDYIEGALEDASGNVYRFGTGNNSNTYTPHVTKYDSNYNFVWARWVGEGDSVYYSYPTGAAIDEGLNQMVVGVSVGNPSSVNFQLVAFNTSTGNRNWGVKCTTSTVYCTDRNVTIDSAGNIYALGYDTSNVGYIFKLNPSGSVIWARSYSVGGSTITHSSDSISVSPDGSKLQIYTRAQEFGNYKPHLITYPADGSFIGTMTLGYYNWTFAASSVALASNSNVAVQAASRQSSFTNSAGGSGTFNAGSINVTDQAAFVTAEIETGYM